MSLYISNKLVRMCLNDALIIWVDPRKIQSYVGSEKSEKGNQKRNRRHLQLKMSLAKRTRRQFTRLAHAFESFVIDPDDYQSVTPVEHHRNYEKISGIIEHGDKFRETEWYRELIISLEERGFAKHKGVVMRSQNDVEQFIQSYVLTMIDSLKKNGFDPNMGGGIGRALIGKDGSLHKSVSGRHRFFASRELAIKPFPLQVAGAHEEWYRNQIGNTFRPKILKSALSDIQANYA